MSPGTDEFLNGEWYAEGEMPEGKIIAGLCIDERVELSMFINGKAKNIAPFSSTAHWVGEFLCFTDNQRFFVKYANENEMLFGELVKAGDFNGKYRWALIFKRVG